MISLYEIKENKKGDLYIIKNNKKTYLKYYCKKLNNDNINWQLINIYDKLYIKIGG